MDTMFADKVRADGCGINEDEEKKKNKRRIVFAVIGIIVVSIVIGAYVYEKYFGQVSLKPGEQYTVNIPFIGAPNIPIISGKAIDATGKAVKDINVTVKYKGNATVLAWNTTGNDGKYVVYLPEIKTAKSYDVYVGNYDNSTLTLGSNDYTFKFNDSKIYNKSVDYYAVLEGTITNKDATIEDGRIDVNLKYYDTATDKWVEIFGYKTYYANILPNEVYEFPNDEFNVSWKIPSDAAIEKYKFYVKTSFNAEEKTKSVYFNITE
ncbi:hypothetical protein MSIBF_A3000006 [groundwater metagenome]|uniref:Carboxypeptidase regulatory-like domain-containing protein n=1 Tax=groundwater metagenome TaxID=717931 RepID=A0A098EBS4_9ZZZZ